MKNSLLLLLCIAALYSCNKADKASTAQPPTAVVSDSGRIDTFAGIYYYHFSSASDYNDYVIDTVVAMPCKMYVSYPTNDSINFSSDGIVHSFTFRNSWGNEYMEGFYYLSPPFAFLKTSDGKYSKYRNQYLRLTPDSLLFEHDRPTSDIQFKGGDGYTYTDAIFRGKKS